MLADSGYHSILPDQLYAYLNTGAALPSKPIMFTFDDTDMDQFTIAAPTLKKYGYKAVYFIMTVSIGKKGKFVDYMSKEQIKQLSDEGNVIGSHTYDHKNFKKYQGKDWEEQLDKPTKKLEEITGKKMTEFAYPFGLWNAEGIPERTCSSSDGKSGTGNTSTRLPPARYHSAAVYCRSVPRSAC